MPRLTHSVPKYRRHRGSNQAVVTLNCQDHYLGPYGTKTSRLEYDRLIGEWLAAGRNSLGVSGYDLTIVELCARYWNFAVGYYRANPKTMPGIKRMMTYLRDRYGRTRSVEFGPLALKAVRQRMVDEGLSRGYVNDLLFHRYQSRLANAELPRVDRFRNGRYMERFVKSNRQEA